MNAAITGVTITIVMMVLSAPTLVAMVMVAATTPDKTPTKM